MKQQNVTASSDFWAWFLGCLVRTVWIFSAGSLAAGMDSANFNVKVTIVKKTCNVNNNNPIDVDFGDLIIRNIDGVAYEENIPYTLDCGDETPLSQGLKLQFVGTGAVFNGNLLSTSEPDLGLRFKSNGTVFPLNEWVPFLYGQLPSLSVVPVASGVNGLNDGEFTATATFNVEYQ